MAETTGIEWCHATWSPWEGCTKVSPGCDHCYAAGMNRWLRKGENWGPGAPRRIYSSDHWEKPLRWNKAAEKAGKRLRVFPSVCDPFDNEVAPIIRARFFQLIERTPWIDWLLLTKRIGNAAQMMFLARGGHLPLLSNVWLGATIVNQEEADRDIPKLLATPAQVRFLSMEPLLGPVDLTSIAPPVLGDGREYAGADVLSKHNRTLRNLIDWVIVGGESGHGARPMNPQWARDIRDQCAAAGVAFLHKQNGEFASVSEVEGPGAHHTFEDGRTVRRVGKKAAGRLLDGVQHDGFPEALP